MRKKCISFLLILSILLSLFMPIVSKASADDDSIRFWLESSTYGTGIKKGDIINVAINMELLFTELEIDTIIGFVSYNTELLAINYEELEDIDNYNSVEEDDRTYCVTSESSTAFNSISIYCVDSGMSFNLGRQTKKKKSGCVINIEFIALQDFSTTEITLLDDVDCAGNGDRDFYVSGNTITVPKTPEEYNIVYNANTTDTVTGMPENGSKLAGEEYTIANGPSRVGYNFIGWNTTSEGNGTGYAAGASYTTDESVELFAQWETITSTLIVDPNGGVWEESAETQEFAQEYGTTKTISAPTTTPNGYVVRFNASANDGTTDVLQLTQTTTFSNWSLEGAGSFDGSAYTYNDGAATLTANYTNDSIVLPNASRTGATFMGWYTEQVGGTKVGDAGDNYTPTEAITLFAQFEDNDYTLTVNPNGGTWKGSSETQTVTGTYNTTTDVPNPVAPAGYTVTLNNEGVESTVVQTTSFDKWTYTDETVFEGETYTFGDSNKTIKANYILNSVELSTPVKPNYTFDGWYTAAEGGDKVESPYLPTSDITLYAHWSANTYVVSFDPGEGVTPPADITVTYGEAYGELPEVSKDGYVFQGWYDPEDNHITEDSIVEITEDTTLTAKWVGAEYNVNFDANGGTCSTASKVVVNGEQYGELPEATRVGYEFDGWFTADDDEIESTSIVNTTSDITLFAHWTAIKTTLTVNPNGGTWEGSNEAQNFEQDYNTTKEIADPTATPDGFVVTFNGNGGNSSVTEITQTTSFDKWTLSDESVLAGTTYTFGLTNETVKANYVGNSITLPTATKTGSTLIGWFTDAEEGTKVGEAGETYTPTGAVTLYAHYEYNEYTLTVKPEGGLWNGSTDDQNIIGVYGSSREIENPVAPDGYTVTLNNDGVESTIVQTTTFTNWLLSSGDPLEGTTYTYGPADETLTAVYEGNSVELPTPTKEGYRFIGWATSAEGETVVDLPYTPTEDITLYAIWDELLYLRSETYLIGDRPESYTRGTITEYKEGDLYIGNILPYVKRYSEIYGYYHGTTVSQFREGLITNADSIEVRIPDGRALNDDELVGTNMIVTLSREGSEDIVLRAVVLGDVLYQRNPDKTILYDCGDGCMTGADQSYFFNNKFRDSLEGAYFNAGDVSQLDNLLKSSDVSMINNVMIGGTGSKSGKIRFMTHIEDLE